MILKQAMLLAAWCAAGTAMASMEPLPSARRDSAAVHHAPPLPPDEPRESAAEPVVLGRAPGDLAPRDTERTPQAAPADEVHPAPSQTANGATSLEGPPVPLPPRRQLRDASPADGALPPDRPISLDFQRADLPAALHAFAQFTRLNIVASERVRGHATLRLDRVPWRAAFDLLLEANGLAMERVGGVIWVAPAADLAARERQRFEAHARAADLEPLTSRAFTLHYAHAEDLRKLLTGSGAQRVLSKRGSAAADARTNLLFVTDLAVRVDEIAALVAQLDQPARQVLIEARIVEGDQGLSRNLGVRLAVSATADGGPGRGVTGAAAGSGDGTVYDFSAGALSGFGAAQVAIALLAARATRLLDLELSALEAEGRGRVVSAPRVVTADRTRAIVEQGTELPYQAKVAQGVSGVQFRRASLKLEVEPRITPEGRVILDLDVAKDSIGEQTAAGPAINTKHVQTRVEIEDGGTVSIGGIDATDHRDDVARVPLLGRIPVLGALFSHRAHRGHRSELVVLITPRVIRADSAASTETEAAADG